MPQPASSSKYQRTHHILVTATLAELCAEGNFSAESVTGRCDHSVATFYKHFASKDEALTEAFALALDSLVDLAATDWHIEKLLTEGSLVLCEQGVHSAAMYFSRYLLVFRTALAALPNSKGIREVYRSHEMQILKQFENFVRFGQHAGKIRGRADQVGDIALTHLILMQGLNNHNLLNPVNRTLCSHIARAAHANLIDDRTGGGYN